MSRQMSDEISKGMGLIFAKAEFVVVGRVFFFVSVGPTRLQLIWECWFGCIWVAFNFLPACICLVSAMIGICSHRGRVEGRKSFGIFWWVHAGRLAGTCLLWGSLRIHPRV